MSLAINVDLVTHVLLADGWHTVHGDSFDLDAYEYMHEKNPIVKGGSVAGVPSTGAVWLESDGTRIMCPLTSVLAVRVK